MSWKLGMVSLAVLAATGIVANTAAPSRGAAAAVVSFKIFEWNILPVATTKAKPGSVTFVVRNTGKLTHEFVVLKTPKPAGNLASATAKEAPEAGAVGEIEEIKAGATKRLTLKLAKGHYSLICNLAGHYGRGQFVDFYVR